MKTFHKFAPGIFALMVLLGGLGLGIVATQEFHIFKGRAEELKLPPIINNQPSPIVSYASSKYGYSLSFDKTLWTEVNGISQDKQNLKSLSFELNPQFGSANIIVQAYDENEFQSAANSPLNKAGKDSLEKITLFVQHNKDTLSSGATIAKSEKIATNGKDRYKFTIEEPFLNGKITYYQYIFTEGKNYYVVTAKYLPGTPTELTEKLINSFSFASSNTTVKGASDSETPVVTLDETQITELTNPSIVNIATIYCPKLTPKIDPITIATLSAQPIQHVKPSYKFCTGGTGSGFIITKDGHIATNGHVAKMFPLTSFVVALYYQTDPEIKQFILDLHKQEFLRFYKRELSKQEEKWSEDSFNAFKIRYWAMNMIEQLLEEKRLTFDETDATRYFVKLGNNPLPIDPLTSKKGEDLFKNIKETEDIRAASLVDYDYPNNDDMDVLTQKKLPKIGADVAIIKIKNTDGLTFPSLRLVDVQSIKEGNNILIVGYPGIVGGSASSSSLLNFKSSAKATITRGIISAVKEAQDGKKLLQTDATLSSGNSGGPGLDKYGNVIGISTYSYAGAFLGISGNYNFLRSTEEISNLMKNKQLNNSDNPTYEAWHRGLSNYWNGYYRKSLKDFKTVKEIYPIHPSVNSYISEAQIAIKDGEDKEGIWGTITEVIPTAAIAAISALFVIIGAGGIFFIFKRKKHLLPPPPTPSGTIPGTTIPLPRS